MRSVERTPWPKDENGRLKKYRQYKSFYRDLIENFGSYCSYCERPDSVDIEHVIPKSKPLGKDLETNWENLLLACECCNRDNKKSKNDSREGYVWPDMEDTFQLYVYDDAGDLTVKSSLNESLKIKAQATIDLCGLAPTPKALTSKRKDYLWKKRFDIWQLAERQKTLFENNKTTAEYIAQIAKSTGYWSVWVTVFEIFPEVIHTISEQFPGTRRRYLYSDPTDL